MTLREILQSENLHEASSQDQALRTFDRDYPPSAQDRFEEIQRVVRTTGVKASVTIGRNAKKIWISVDGSPYFTDPCPYFDLHQLNDPWFSLSKDAKKVLVALFAEWPSSEDGYLSSNLDPIDRITLFYKRTDDNTWARVALAIASA